jgi:hypothetical protein
VAAVAYSHCHRERRLVNACRRGSGAQAALALLGMLPTTQRARVALAELLVGTGDFSQVMGKTRAPASLTWQKVLADPQPNPFRASATSSAA